MEIGKFWHFFIEICSLAFDRWKVIIGLQNGLAPIRRQAIIETNVDKVQGRIYAALGWDELSVEKMCY